MQLIICKITSVFPQTLIRYILKQDLPMSLEDSLTLAEAYKLPTSQINYLYVIHLIGQSKVCKSSQEFLTACYWLILLFCVPDIFVWDFLYCVFLQTEEILTLLKKLPSAEAECVIERLTSWARMQLEDKEHISDEVQKGRRHLCGSAFYAYLFLSVAF